VKGNDNVIKTLLLSNNVSNDTIILLNQRYIFFGTELTVFPDIQQSKFTNIPSSG